MRKCTSLRLITVASGLLTCSVASAAIIPSWRVNPIPTPPPGNNPGLVNAFSVSLMVELTGGSLFNVAGLDLAPLLPGVTFFNQTPFGSDVKPSAALVAAFPDLAFDSYVGTTSDAIPAVPGRLNGTGAAQVGINGQFNVAWGATPNTGGTGPLEIARITIMNHVFLAPSIHIPLANGRVRDSLTPNADVALPPMPLVPEPASAFALAASALILVRRAR